MQCEGSRWKDALYTWLRDEKTLLKKQREEANRRKEKEAAPAPKKRKKIDTEPDPALNDDLEEKLKMGLDILIRLAHIIHEAVCNTPFLATEPGCRGFFEHLKLENTSLLLSVPSKLEPYPGRTGRHNSWMGQNAVRFWKEQRGTVPAEGAAPAAAQEAAPAAEGGAALAAGAAQKAVATADGVHGGAAAAADADGPGGAAVGADGGAAAADSGEEASTPRIGKVRSLLLPPTGTEIMTFFQPHNIMADTREGAGGP